MQRAPKRNGVGCDICRDTPKPEGQRVRCRACGTEYGENAHVCHALGCNVKVPPKLLMCRKHWFMVPKPLRDAVWAAYVPGQEIRKDPTDEYLEAQRAAVDAVATKEGKLPAHTDVCLDCGHPLTESDKKQSVCPYCGAV